MGKFINEELLKEKQEAQDKDLIIADLISTNSTLNQRLSDAELIIADLLGGKTT